MTVFKVIKRFVDLQDDKYAYNVGDVFPRKGLNVTDARLKELSSNKNKRGEALIVEVFEGKKEAKEEKVDAKELLDEIETKKKSRKKKK